MQRKQTNQPRGKLSTYIPRAHQNTPDPIFQTPTSVTFIRPAQTQKLCKWPTDHFYEDSLSHRPTKVSRYAVKEETRQAVTVCQKLQQVTYNVIPSWQKA